MIFHITKFNHHKKSIFIREWFSVFIKLFSSPNNMLTLHMW